MRYVGIIERLTDGPRYEDANLAAKPRGRASPTLAASYLMPITVRGRVAATNPRADPPFWRANEVWVACS
jgi:hypothetical protein